MEKKKLIEFRNIVKNFDGQIVLKGVNLDIYEKEFVTLLGPSGCGKTTLARTLVEHYENAIHLDIDKVGHKALMIEEVKNELIKSYGNDILNGENIDRKKLGEIVFNSRIKMK